MALNNPGIPQIPHLRGDLDGLQDQIDAIDSVTLPIAQSDVTGLVDDLAGKADFVRLTSNPINEIFYTITGGNAENSGTVVPITTQLNSSGPDIWEDDSSNYFLEFFGSHWLFYDAGSGSVWESNSADVTGTWRVESGGATGLPEFSESPKTTGQFALVDDGTNPPAMWKNLGTDDSPDWVEMTDGGGGVSLGETSTTAYRGDRGKTAYDHSQETGNAHDLDASQVRSILGVSTLSGSNTGDQTLPTRTSLGINNVDNVSAADLRARSTHTGTQPLSTLSQSGATTNQVASWSGTAWVPATVSGGGSTNASDLTSGTLADARLSSNVPLKNAANTFTADQTINGNLTASGTGRFSDAFRVQSNGTNTSSVPSGASGTGIELSSTWGNGNIHAINWTTNSLIPMVGYASQYNWHINAYNIFQINRFDVNVSGHLLFREDGSYDIGATSANRPRHIYALGTVKGAELEATPVTFAGLPPASSKTGKSIQVSDRDYAIATSNGTNWLRAGTSTVLT